MGVREPCYVSYATWHNIIYLLILLRASYILTKPIELHPQPFNRTKLSLFSGTFPKDPSQFLGEESEEGSFVCKE